MSASPLPRLTHARLPLTRELSAVNEYGELQRVWIPVERALTVYVDKRELVTLMTLGAQPELLVLGYLRNQRLITNVHEVESITVDWEVGAAAVKTRSGIANIEAKTASKVVTTGCGQGSVFGSLMADVDKLVLPPATLTQEQLYGIVNAIRVQDSTYKTSGSVHGCALFRRDEMLTFVEDVGRHNAMDKLVGSRLAVDALPLANSIVLLSGRASFELVQKAGAAGVPLLAAIGAPSSLAIELAEQAGITLVAFLRDGAFNIYTHGARLR